MSMQSVKVVLEWRSRYFVLIMIAFTASADCPSRFIKKRL